MRLGLFYPSLPSESIIPSLRTAGMDIEQTPQGEPIALNEAPSPISFSCT